MKTTLGFFLIAVLSGSLALPQTAPATPAKKKKTTPSSVKASAKRKKTTAKKKPASAPLQSAPTPDRYREIQQALADKGYLKSEPNGVWDDRSAAALKQFQTDQHLSPTGKISALSLINLGLGPRAANTPAPIPAPSALQESHPSPATDPPPPPENLPPPAN